MLTYSDLIVQQEFVMHSPARTGHVYKKVEFCQGTESKQAGREQTGGRAGRQAYTSTSKDREADVRGAHIYIYCIYMPVDARTIITDKIRTRRGVLLQCQHLAPIMRSVVTALQLCTWVQDFRLDGARVHVIAV